MSIRAFDVLDSSCTWRITASLIDEELMVKSGLVWRGRARKASVGEL